MSMYVRLSDANLFLLIYSCTVLPTVSDILKLINKQVQIVKENQYHVCLDV